MLADAEPGLHFLPHIGEIAFLVGVAVIAAIGALSHEHKRPFSAALIYLALGAAAAWLLPALGMQHIRLEQDHEVFEYVTAGALAVAVFATGLRIRRAPPRRWKVLVLLLVVTMPLTAAAVALYATTAMGLPLAAAIILGAALAPTDPVLAGDVGLSGPGENADQARARAAITAEAGANDGAAMPMLVLGFAVAEHADGGADLARWVTTDLLFAVGVAIVLGAAIGWVASLGFQWMRERELLESGFDGWAAVAVALIVYGAVELAGGYGFVGGFAAGLAFRRRDYESQTNRDFHDGAVVAEDVLTLAVVLLFGSALTLDALEVPGLGGWLLAPLLFLVIRPLASLPALLGTQMPWRERLYVAWFGVKGIAAINYAAVAVAAGVLTGGDESTVLWTVAVCVIVSIVVHGVTATALSQRLLDRD